MPATILIIDDHPLMRDAVKMTMEAIAPGCRVDLAASYAEGRRMLAADVPYDYLLLDLNLPDSSGLQALTALRERFPTVPVIVLSAQTDRDVILRCLEAGAAGYIPKTYHADVMTHALRLVTTGHVYVPREAIDSVRHLVQEPPSLMSRPGAGNGDPRQLGLTERQCDVLRLILRGLPNKLICR
ncbi:MAG: response regulator, partial [Burkholderiaceae bacterium]